MSGDLFNDALVFTMYRLLTSCLIIEATRQLHVQEEQHEFLQMIQQAGKVTPYPFSNLVK